MASEATEPVTPASATMKVRNFGLTLVTMARTSADKSPDCSATATPSMTARMTPNGGKLVKFSTASVTMREIFSVVRRDSTSMVSPDLGSSALMPIKWPIHEVMATMIARMTKSQKGSGSLLPIFSTVPKKPLAFSGFSLVLVSAIVSALSVDRVGHHCVPDFVF